MTGLAPTELTPEEQAKAMAVFIHQDETRWRYIPQWQPDGTWRAWDRREQRSMSASEILKMPLPELRDELFLN